MNSDIIEHYDLLVDEGNDPVLDPPALQNYMDKWDGNLFIDLLEINKSKNVLEIGCGTGRLAVKVAPKVQSYCGIDISPKTVNIAKGHLPSENIKLVCGDFIEYNFGCEYDLIYSSLTFLHIEDKKRAIEKVHRLLENGGIFVLSIDKNQDTFLDYGTRKVKVYPDNPEEIISIMKFAGFIETEKYEVEFAYIIKAKRNV